MLNVVIIEDEIRSQETLKSLLTEFCDDVNVLGMAGNVRDAVALINKVRPELIFLDIELQTGTGFDVLNQIGERNFDVIFTTAFEQYAIKAIKFSSLDYLLKPIDIDELQEALEKARKRIDRQESSKQLSLLLKNMDERPNQRKKICLSTSEGLEFIDIENIRYCEANGSYTNFNIKPDVKLIVSKNLKEYESLLSDHSFMRVHNSFLINLHEVKKFVKSEGGYILMNDGTQIAISQSKRDEFMERMMSLS
ncbi:LytTR family DNA-binding domain-containing protein [Fulvivirga ulvae]|uniref:LytR/AlgR family response regulator transcription factor n=1 Tax=Fulvivirga ulvae TaxID=2904245 RepID=UPI001F176462|nr:LytTR family DNA-binding domain-containing protein [Fulvivirga ulvae]UII32859.1 LytTR family DNA-binding domain-containing protein [Fulvivirga ulvae]